MENPANIDDLASEYTEKIYRLAYRMTGSQEDAEDITQETLFQVARHLDDFLGNSQLSTWIYAIARNSCYHHLRARRPKDFADFETLIESAALAPETENLAVAEKHNLAMQVKEGCLTGLLQCLPYSQRMAFILHSLLHLPIRDVAAILEKSEGAVKVLVHRARSGLKGFLCANCSLYDPANPCRCENLVEFSLRQRWISRTPAALLADRAEKEIYALRDVVELYAGLQGPQPTPEFTEQIQRLLKTENWSIFDKRAA
jgi:RNA polymerase sigma factor (sigma-70 family)